MKNIEKVKTVREMRKEDVQEAYFKASKELRELNPRTKQSDIFAYALKTGAPRFYVSFENARRYISLMARGKKIPITNANKLAMYTEIYRRYCGRIAKSTEARAFTVLEDIIEEPAPSFYLDMWTFQGIVYRAFRRAKK